MHCNNFVFRPIFNVFKMARTNESFYIFIGNDISKRMGEIINKIEKKTKLTINDQQYLKKTYKLYYKSWLSIVKRKTRIIFIYDNIRIDDSIKDIKNKIFIYTSDIKKDDFLIPQNQQLWIKLKNGEKKIIGFYYSEEKHKLEPVIDLTNPKPDNNFVDKSGFKKRITDLVNNHGILVNDLLTCYNFKTYTFYVTDALSEYNLFKSKTKIGDRWIYGYFYKYWPKFIQKIDIKTIRKKYYTLESYYRKTNYIFKLLNTTQIPIHQFSTCYISHITFHINGKSAEDQSTIKVVKNVNLFKIFDYLKNNIDEKTPFIRYKDETFGSPYSLVSKKALDKKMVTKVQLLHWVGIANKRKGQGKILKNITNLHIKRFIKYYNNIPFFSHVEIEKTGRIVIRIGYKNEYKATFQDVLQVVENCVELIEEINKIDYKLSGGLKNEYKLNPPGIRIEDNKILLKPNTKIPFFTSIINYDIPNKIESVNFKELYKLSKSFEPFVLVSKHDERANSFHSNYKRVKNFANMEEIYSYISEIKIKKIYQIFML